MVFSSIVGTSLFATLADPNAVIYPAFKIAIGLISLAAAILAALQTFLRFGERAEKHVVAADWYAAVRRDIDQLLALSPKERGTPRSCFDRLRKQMSKVGQHSPEIGDGLWKDMAAKYCVYDPAPCCRKTANVQQSYNQSRVLSISGRPLKSYPWSGPVMSTGSPTRIGLPASEGGMRVFTASR